MGGAKQGLARIDNITSFYGLTLSDTSSGTIPLASGETVNRTDILVIDFKCYLNQDSWSSEGNHYHTRLIDLSITFNPYLYETKAVSKTVTSNQLTFAKASIKIGVANDTNNSELQWTKEVFGTMTTKILTCSIFKIYKLIS